jgi:hypothetical protein
MLTNTLPRLILRSPTTLCRLAVTVFSLNPGTAHSVQIEPAEWAKKIRLKPTLLLGSNSEDDSTAHSPAYIAAGASPPGRLGSPGMVGNTPAARVQAAEPAAVDEAERDRLASRVRANGDGRGKPAGIPDGPRPDEQLPTRNTRERVQPVRRPRKPRVGQRYEGARVPTSVLIDDDALLLVLECLGKDVGQGSTVVRVAGQHTERSWIGAWPREIRGVAKEETALPVQFPDRADDRQVLDGLRAAISGKGRLAIDTTHERAADGEQDDRRKQGGNPASSENTHSHLRPFERGQPPGGPFGRVCHHRKSTTQLWG